jgi:hypothetical protein
MISRSIDENFDQLIPDAADRAGQFLGVLQKRCQAEGIGVDLVPNKPERKKDRVILVGSVPAGARPRRLEVFADPTGRALHVGWQTTVQVNTGMLAGTTFVRHLEAGIDQIDAKAEHVTRLSGILRAFHELVFLPVLQQLADATERAHTAQSQSGFFGA